MSLMNPAYPNLELLEYQTKEFLMKDKETVEKIKAWQEDHKHLPAIELEVYVFPQTWGNTATGFDVTANGEPVMAGQAFTKEYTSLFHELHTDTFVIFFGEHPCYLVKNPTEAFYEDFKERRMASMSEAKKKY